MFLHSPIYISLPNSSHISSHDVRFLVQSVAYIHDSNNMRIYIHSSKCPCIHTYIHISIHPYTYISMCEYLRRFGDSKWFVCHFFASHVEVKTLKGSSLLSYPAGAPSELRSCPFIPHDPRRNQCERTSATSGRWLLLPS